MRLLDSKISLLILCIVVSTTNLFAQYRRPEVGYELISPDRPISKISYFTMVMDGSDEVKQEISQDTELRRIAEQVYRRLEQSGDDPRNIAKSLLLTETESVMIGDRMTHLLRGSRQLRALLERDVIGSGCYYTHTGLSSGEEILRAALSQDIDALNQIIRVYGAGDKPRYNIDSISWQQGGKTHRMLLRESKDLLLQIGRQSKLYYTLPLYAAELFLDLNDRDEPSVYEPLGEGENQRAYRLIPTTEWSKYEYSALLVLGFGPDNYRFPLNPGGKIRLRTAAEKFKSGAAPFIIVSGGKVYPYKTQSVEAYGMKKYLVKECGIPSDRIIIEPHARHTTSNIRNTVRIMYRRGFPMDKPFIVSSSESHINAVMSPAFQERCEREMGLQPCKYVRRLGKNFAELLPLECSLQINITDPLDA